MDKKRGYAYARYSSNNQREESIEEQLLKIQEYAERNNIEIINQYTDFAKSGSKNVEKREAFMTMINDIEKGEIKVDYVIVYCLSRFMRNIYESAIYKKKLKDRNIRLISVTENLSDNPESIILESVLDAVNEYYSLNLSRETMRGLMFNAKQGLNAGGFAPLGYKIVEGKLVINEDERPIVELVFNRYVEGHSLMSIANELNDLGYRTRRGKLFKASSFSDLLSNEKMTGTYVYNKRIGNSRGKKISHQYKDENEIVKIPDCFEPIISKDVFKKAQEIRQSKMYKGGRAKAKETYLLSGLIYCGECEPRDDGILYSFSGNRRKGKDRPKYVSYRCSQRRYKCQNKEIRKEYIEDYVLDELEKKIFTEKGIKYIVVGINKLLSQSNDENTSKIRSIEKNIKELDNQVDNILNAIKKGIFDDSFTEELNNLRLQKSRLVEKLDETRSSIKVIEPVSSQSIKDMINEFKDYLTERNSVECKRLLHTFVNRVIVFREYVEVEFKIALDFLDLEFKDVSRISRSELRTRYKSKYCGKAVPIVHTAVAYDESRIERA